MISIQKMSWILQIPDDFSDMLQKKPNKTKQSKTKRKMFSCSDTIHAVKILFLTIIAIGMSDCSELFIFL